MGMAASQARHLALVARRSNCEYEGQQINQARTALANQSANLFNQMLGLEVPIPPSTQDFTKTQYSFKDGVNASTIDSWQQLATPEEEYNYVVTHHYYTDVYTGSQKKLTDPQVQYSAGTAANSTQMAASMKTLTANKAKYDEIQEEYANILTNYENAQKALEEAQKAEEEAQKIYDEAYDVVNNPTTGTKKLNEDAGKAFVDFINSDGYVNAEQKVHDAWDALLAEEKNQADLTKYQNGSWSYPADTPILNAGVYTVGADEFKSYKDLPNDYVSSGGVTKQSIKDSIDRLIANGALPSDFDINNAYISHKDSNPGLAFKSDLDNAHINANNGLAGTVPRYDLNNANSIINKADKFDENIATYESAYETAQEEYSTIWQPELVRLGDAAVAATNEYERTNAILEEAEKALNVAKNATASAEATLALVEAAKAEAEDDAGKNWDKIKDDYESALADFESFSSPSYIGNCELTYLESLTTDQSAEIRQVVSDMIANDIDASINGCFDEDGNYIGGIYSFKMNGITYYTTYNDLYESYSSGTGINHIDGQTKMAYYNADYISTKIEKTEKALLETDGNGRFASVRFEDNSITYTLNMETITDDVAYQDAMNQYYYENAIYDKTIQDINAKTSIIQQQDQQLELRLKQLDTEHTALTTEIEAVSKVVKDNVESTFKTFGG